MPASRIASLCVGALLLAGLSSAQAALAPTGVSGQVSFNHIPPTPVQVTGFGKFGLVESPFGSVQFTVAGTPRPSLLGEVFVFSGVTGRSVGQLIYQVQIVGPDGLVPVFVDVAGHVGGSSTLGDPFAGFAMKARWDLEDQTLGLQPVFGEGIESGTLAGSFSDGFNHRVPLTLTANHVYRVTLTADAFAAASSGHDAGASAFIDPVFSFAAGAGTAYTFAFSEGIGNAPVPEPQAWLLMCVGLAGLVLRLRPASAG